MAKIINAIVAPRRTVEIKGKPYGPGSEISLSEDEVSTLRASGFLLPDKDTSSKIDKTKSDSSARNGNKGIASNPNQDPSLNPLPDDPNQDDALNKK